MLADDLVARSGAQAQSHVPVIRTMRRLALLLLLLSACRTSEHSTTSPPAPVTAAPAPTYPDNLFPEGGPCRLTSRYLVLPPVGGRCDATRCAAAQGECVWGGFGCDEVCARRTRDGGKRCHDDRECESGCVAPPKTDKGEHVDGTCRTTLVGFGCSNHVVAGVAQGEICAD